MDKDFDNWNKQKKQINSAKQNRLYNAREIWWCSLGVNVGYEHDGFGPEFQRPILIIKGLGSRTCLAAPLTSSKSKHPLRIPVGLVHDKEASVILSQLRVIDTKRFTNKVDYLDQSMFDRIRKTIKDML